MSPFRENAGLTLIEVLVGLLVLSIGLVGIAGLHLSSLSATHSSYHRTVATLIATDAEERLWLSLGQNKSITPAHVSTVETQWATHWNAKAILPTPATLSLASATSPNDDWISVVITITWPERRFGGTQESLTYRTRIVTSPFGGTSS